MCKYCCLALGVWIFATASLSAQTAPPDAAPVKTIEWRDPGNLTSKPAVLDAPCPDDCKDDFRFWARVDYLLWWTKNAPMPVPLVTTGNHADAVPGAIGQPGTQVLLGDSNINFRAAYGIRFTLGMWFDSYHNIGMEGNFFSLERQFKRFYASGDDAGNPVLAFPFFNTMPGSAGETVLPISTPGSLTGDVRVVSTLELWGTELNAAFCLWRDSGREFTILAGFRYVDLRENLFISNTTYSLGAGPNSVAFLNDSFSTRNQFYGAQIGGKYHCENERFSLDVIGKLALGGTHQIVDINGSSSFYSGGFSYAAGGLYTQPSNIGRYTADQLTVIPSVELKIGYRLSQQWRAFVGYDFLYWNQVVRPGNQIDRNINVSQNAILGSGTLSGPATPGPLFQRSDFWAQGMNVGVEFRF